jgi:protein-L-isoaspartate(D-aspartate) O-methyltransferase
MTDSARQRLNMVESQIRPSDVTDRRILRAMASIARETFVPPALVSLAYMDEAVALHAPSGQRGALPRRMLSPRTFAKLLQLASVEAGDRVLDVGAGRGYSSAVISELAERVWALECDGDLSSTARAALAAKTKVSVTDGPLPAGLPANAPFDVIVVEGAITAAPSVLLEQLAPSGRCVAIVMDGRIGRATVWRRGPGGFAATSHFEAAGDVLPGFETAPSFVL